MIRTSEKKKKKKKKKKRIQRQILTYIHISTVEKFQKKKFIVETI